MTRSDLIATLASRFSQLVTQDAEIAVKTIIDTMAHTLAHGNRAEIRGFGSFCLTFRRSRTGRNPKTGEKVNVPGKHFPHFYPGKGLRERVDPSTSTDQIW